MGLTVERDPARTLTHDEWMQLLGLKDGRTWEETARLLKVGLHDLTASIFVGVDRDVLTRIREAIGRNPVKRW